MVTGNRCTDGSGGGGGSEEGASETLTDDYVNIKYFSVV